MSIGDAIVTLGIGLAVAMVAAPSASAERAVRDAQEGRGLKGTLAQIKLI